MFRFFLENIHKECVKTCSMEKIYMGDMVIPKKTRPYLSRPIKHPYVYDNGVIDLTPIATILSELYDKDDMKQIIYTYLKNPNRYTKELIPIHPEYLSLY